MKYDKDKKTVTVSGIGFTGLLTIAFIVLKLCKVITWSWVWVFAPLWIPVAVVFAIMIIYLIVVVIGMAIDG